MIERLEAAAAALAFIVGGSVAALPSQEHGAFEPSFTVATFDELPGLPADDLAAAFDVFRASCAAVTGAVQPLRASRAPPAALRHVCGRALALALPVSSSAAHDFFATEFEPRRLTAPAFLTGYYEPVVEASLVRTAEFRTPLLAFPTGLEPAAAGSIALRRRPDGTMVPMPDRAAIETGALGSDAAALAWVREPVDAFFIQVQGSARLLLPNGATRRLAYAGRNGYPYTSIGKVLVDALHIPPSQMGMSELKGWIRAHGQGPDAAGTELMRRNASYIFFRFDDALPAAAGPVGAAGVSLTALRSLAVDRMVWPYGLPIYIDAELPRQGEAPTRLQRLMVAQDTGSAIVGPARADIFFGSGPAAAARAGAIRHPGTLFVLWPKDLGSEKLKSGGTDGTSAR